MLFSRFIDKQQKLKNLKNAQVALNDRFSNKFESYVKMENLRTSILKYRKKNDILKDLIKEKRVTIQRLQVIKKDNHDRNRSQRMILPKYEDKVNKLGDYVFEAIEKNESLRKKSQNQMTELQALRRFHIEKLMKYIFPITQKLQVLKNANSEQDVSQMSEIILSSDSNSPSEYVIADGPTLPSTGDYFEQYSKWFTCNKEEASSPSSNEAGRIAQTAGIVAGLTYLQQLMQGLSFFLDIRLPHKISINDFCKIALNEPQFRKKVARLNLNVVYLTYMQNVSTRSIQPERTIENVLLLIDPKNENLGQTTAIQDTSDTKSIDSIILSFTDLVDDNESGDMSDFDSEDEVHKEWENVSHNISPTSDVTQSAIPVETNGMTTTLRNVAHSLWKGWK